MPSLDSLLHELEHSDLFRFADWPHTGIPRVSAGAYTIWCDGELIYVGMAGRGLTEEAILEYRSDPSKMTGLYSRLASHAMGRRSGDQFCVYVADRFVLPTLKRETIEAIAAGSVRFDALIRDYITKRLS